jgi:hypothetical protein
MKKLEVPIWNLKLASKAVIKRSTSFEDPNWNLKMQPFFPQTLTYDVIFYVLQNLSANVCIA